MVRGVLGSKRLFEADLDPLVDPANNPGRPEDPYEYIGMHPSPTMAMAHPAAGGGEAGAADGSTDSLGDGPELDDAEATEKTPF